MKPPVRVIAVDDSAVARAMYREILSPAVGFDLIATAPNASIARRKLLAMNPGVVVLDIEMPDEDGLSLLEWIMQTHPVPVVISSSLSYRGAQQTMQALALGAVEVVCKTSASQVDSDGRTFAEVLISAVQVAALAGRKAGRFSHRREQPEVCAPRPPLRKGRVPPDSLVIAIGASTGGTEAIAQLVAAMPRDFPPTLVVQHMPPIYTRAFASRLDTLGEVSVMEATDGQTVGTGMVLIAPGGKQMRAAFFAGHLVVRVTDEPPVNRHAPSVDVLFQSVSETFGKRALGVLLTGMGSDGASGLLAMRQAGGRTIAQNEEDSVVWGMPGAAVKLGAVESVLALSHMLPAAVDWIDSLAGIE